jgi:hypothetical protein
LKELLIENEDYSPRMFIAAAVETFMLGWFHEGASKK